MARGNLHRTGADLVELVVFAQLSSLVSLELLLIACTPHRVGIIVMLLRLCLTIPGTRPSRQTL